MPLADFTGAAALAVVGGYLLVVLVLFLAKRRDLLGRSRPLGCLLGLALFFGLFVVAFAAWLFNDVF